MPKILIIDDDADFRDTCRMILESVDFGVLEAGSPEEGFEKVRAEKPDLVILDILMPREYEGFEVARRIREELHMTALPILMLSAIHDVKQVPYRFEPDRTYLPLDAVLDKAAGPEALLMKAREMLGLYRERPEEPL